MSEIVIEEEPTLAQLVSSIGSSIKKRKNTVITHTPLMKIAMTLNIQNQSMRKENLVDSCMEVKGLSSFQIPTSRDLILCPKMNLD